MARESVLQTKIVTYLKEQGCRVWVIQPQAGIPDATPDIVFFKGPFYGMIEAKKENPYRKDGTAKKGAFQPLQERTVAHFDDWSWARVAYPENWLSVRAELEQIL